jgi:TRAP-type mannitol/chloroaromatic compound transport system permease small subunit
VSSLRRFARVVDRVSVRIGEASAWLYPVLVVVLVANVALRYGLGRGSIGLEELQWHLAATAYLLGFAYAYATGDHVRVDLLRERLGPRVRAAIELLGCLLLLLPFAALTTWHAFDLFAQSLRMGERSAMPGGLPARWFLKGVFAAALALLVVQGLGVAARSLATLLEPRGAQDADGA